jgi:hypothetical protein
MVDNNKQGGPHKYHVILENDEERDVRGTDVRVDYGALVIRSDAGDTVLYAAGAWKLCELERRDDRG